MKSFTLNRLDQNAHSKLDEFINYLQEQKLSIEEPKCNFDVEMALDMLDAVDKVSGILLFSGDSDLHEPLARLKLKGKNIYVFGVRGQVARELWSSCVKYVNFGKWYEGPRKRKSRPRRIGTACLGRSVASLHIKYATNYRFCQGFFWVIQKNLTSWNYSV